MTSESSHSTILATHTPSPYCSFYSGFEDTLKRKAHCFGKPDGCMQPHLGWHGTQSNWSMYCSMTHSRSGFHAPLKEIIITVDNITHTHTQNHWLSPSITSRDSITNSTTNQYFKWCWAPEGRYTLWSEAIVACLFQKLLWPPHHTQEHLRL